MQKELRGAEWNNKCQKQDATTDDVLRGIQGFEWDEGNSGKNERKHGVTDRESEEIFFNKPLVVARSSKGGREVRYAASGKTYGSRF